MENNKICPNCGVNNGNKSLKCKNCGTELNNNDAHAEDYKQNSKLKGSIYTILSLLLFFGFPYVWLKYIEPILPPSNMKNYYSVMAGIGPLIGIILLLIAEAKYPKSKVVKAASMISIISIILCLVFCIVFCISCFYTCNNIRLVG